MTHTNEIEMPVVHMVRAAGGRHTKAFMQGGYVGIGWFEDQDLSSLIASGDKEQLRAKYHAYYADDSNVRIGQNVGQIWRFLTQVSKDSYVATPTHDRSKLIVGKVIGDYEYFPDATDSPYPHRRSVTWFDVHLSRNTLSVPAQNSLRAALTVFKIPQFDEILSPYEISLPDKQSQIMVTEEAVNKLILSQILELSADEFEILVTELLIAIGFEAEHVGRVGDGGIDVTGTLRVYDFATVDLRVQVKRYKLKARISSSNIRDFRGSVPEKAQAAFVTTADFASTARDEADKPGFKKIGLINGQQLVDILVDHYDTLSTEMKEELNLGRTLIPLG